MEVTKLKKFLSALFAVIVVAGIVAGCQKPADVVSANLSTEADNFLVLRRIVFVNGITDKYLLTIEGFCSLGNSDSAGELSVTCKVGENAYKKHFLGLSDNVTYVVEQLDAKGVSPDHYIVQFRPQTIVPDIQGELK